MKQPCHFIVSYVHKNAIGVLVELGVPDSTLAKTEAFALLAQDVATHIAAMAPVSVEELLQHPFVKDPEITVNQLIAQIADGITILRYVRWVAGPEPLQPEPPRSPAVIYNLRDAG